MDFCLIKYDWKALLHNKTDFCSFKEFSVGWKPWNAQSGGGLGAKATTLPFIFLSDCCGKAPGTLINGNKKPVGQRHRDLVCVGCQRGEVMMMEIAERGEGAQRTIRWRDGRRSCWVRRQRSWQFERTWFQKRDKKRTFILQCGWSAVLTADETTYCDLLPAPDLFLFRDRVTSCRATDPPRCIPSFWCLRWPSARASYMTGLMNSEGARWLTCWPLGFVVPHYRVFDTRQEKLSRRVSQVGTFLSVSLIFGSTLHPPPDTHTLT